jgi:hypothetical protein
MEAAVKSNSCRWIVDRVTDKTRAPLYFAAARKVIVALKSGLQALSLF